MTGVLDPFVQELALFGGKADLVQRIAASYEILDEDGSGGLSFEEFSSAVTLLKTPMPIYIYIYIYI